MPPPAQRPLLALAIRLLAMLLIQAMLLLVKLASETGVALPEILFWRQAIPALLILAWLALRKNTGVLRSARMPIHARRAAIGLVGMFLNLGAVTILPLAEATLLAFTSPLFAVLLSAAVLKERVGPWRWGAVVLGFAGITVMSSAGDGAITPLGMAVGISGAMMVALISLQVRDLTRTESPVTIVFWFSALSVPVLAPMLFFTASPHDPHQWLLLAGVGVTGALGQIALTSALRFGEVSSVIVMDYSALLWATMFGWLAFAMLPPAATWAGAPIVVLAGLVVVWRERRLAIERPREVTA